MAFPVAADRNSSKEATAVTTHDVNLPANIVSGNLIVVAFVNDTTAVPTWPGGWGSDLGGDGNDGGSRSRTEIRARIADGTEGATIQITTASALLSVHRSWRFTGAHDVTLPEALGAAGNDANPNPPSLTPSWGAEDDLWLAIAGIDNGMASAYPGSYVNTFTDESASTNVAIATAERSLNAATEDPGTFTIVSNEWWGITVAIRPATPTRRGLHVKQVQQAVHRASVM